VLIKIIVYICLTKLANVILVVEVEHANGDQQTDGTGRGQGRKGTEDPA